MSKVTRKYQVSVPRRLARAHGIEPGTDLTFVSEGEALRVEVEHKDSSENSKDTLAEALASFDAATQRQVARNRRFGTRASKGSGTVDRGWRRDDLYAERLKGG
jgi:bifunctional DNA-binding transcriptional regulator/antitoxin component of YhaV-PrlF toxin-antitoxin module